MDEEKIREWMSRAFMIGIHIHDSSVHVEELRKMRAILDPHQGGLQGFLNHGDVGCCHRCSSGVEVVVQIKALLMHGRWSQGHINDTMGAATCRRKAFRSSTQT